MTSIHASPIGKDNEDDVFMRALRLLYERRLEQLGFQADIIITKDVREEE